MHKVVAEDIRTLSAGAFIEDEVGAFCNAIGKLIDVIFPKFVSCTILVPFLIFRLIN